MTDLKPLIICEPGAVQAASIAQGYEIESIPTNGHLDAAHYSGRRVILWPDATNPSREAFRKFAETISDLCQELKIIVPNGKPHGWNITAAVARDGMSWADLAAWAKSTMITFSKGEFPAKIAVETTEAPDPVPSNVEAIWAQVGIARTERGVINNVDNIVRLLAGYRDFKDIVWYDEFYQRYFTTGGREWRDIDDINLTVRLQRDYGFPRINEMTVSSAVRCRGHQCERNEPKDWLERLRWDGTNRIDTFFHTYFGTAKGAYVSAVGRNFWLGMVARIYNPGCQVDNMVILEGRQGIFKSKALEAIGGKWYMEASEEITSKDFFVALAGKLIVEIADLDSFSRADTTRIKKVITCRTDRYRDPYGRASQDHPRRSIFVGTTNEQHYLRDNTGARRFWPIVCGRIDLDRIRADREHLFAEAVVRYISSEDWYRVPTDETLSQQEDRRQFDEWENLVQAFVRASCQKEVSMTDVAASVGIDAGHLDLTVQRRLGGILRRMGWTSKTFRTGDIVIRKWVSQDSLLNQSPELLPPSPLPETV